MNIVISLFKYFPFGGLQRDMLAIAQASKQRGHDVTIYCSQWQGNKPDHIKIKLLSVKGKNNHTRNRSFSDTFLHTVKQQPVDLILGFNKMPGLDVYYAADTCFKAKVYQERNFFLRFLPRYSQFISFEEQVFSKSVDTLVLALSDRSLDEYQQYYQTPKARFHILPPGISKSRCAPDNHQQIRESFRKEYGVESSTTLLLFVGSGFKTKGLDRLLHAIAALPKSIRQHTYCMIVGQDNNAPYLRIAKNLKIEQKIQFFSGRDDIPNFLLSADLLLHPAYRENTGTVLLEAAIAGLPVLTTSVCGYSHFIRDNNLGCVVDEPFSQHTLNSNLANMLLKLNQKPWATNGREWGKHADIYDMPNKVVDILEQQVNNNG